MSRIEDMMQKMMEKFDLTDENVKEMQNDLSSISQKVDAHAVSIKQIKQQMNQLSTTVNPRQPGTLPSNTIQNLKNDGHGMAVTTRGGKQTIDGYLCRLRLKLWLKKMMMRLRLLEKALEKMPGYGKFMKDLVTKKRVISFEDDDRLQHCSVIAMRSLVQKKEDPGAFTIPCTIGLLNFAKALCDLGASINLMPLSIYKKFGLEAPKSTAMRLLMADRNVKRSIGVLQDVLVKVESFIFPANFLILDCEVSIIIGRPFLITGRALVDMEKGQMRFRLNSEEVTFNICRSIKQESDLKSMSVVNHIMDRGSDVSIEVRLGVDALTVVMMNFEGDDIEDYN
ncbi:hypothetical protein R3W88_033022 [Solanum pinnatisectum]|uniref:Uncharacterized protein n=1 Tax=Solanum pinnatisectum TaxID=50273 RepID=A0AAV9K2Q2_9SOLN|nr:hypothetical protein R3W88_033022 [Solanum pinnatisectum]